MAINGNLGYEKPIRAVILGASGGIGRAMTSLLLESQRVEGVWAVSRSEVENASVDARFQGRRLDITIEHQISKLSDELRSVAPNLIVNCTGRLHTTEYGPERSWKHLDMETMRSVFEVNTFGVALLIKHLVPVMPPKDRGVFASLSARVSSIGDNRLGGWYSYRASKTAQNMLLKTASLEAKRRYPALALVGLHPGTVATQLSSPFTRHLPKTHQVFTPFESANHLLTVIGNLSAADSGSLFAWDGTVIPW